MNTVDIKIHADAHGYLGLFRLAWRSDFYPVTKPDGSPAYFKNPKDAELSAWRSLNRIEHGNMVRSGSIISLKEAKKLKADKLFRKGKVIPVEVRA